MKTTKHKTPAQFFYEHAGYNYDPKTETETQGRRRCARSLAKAEQFGRDAGLSFIWDIDEHCTSRDFSDSKPYWSLWTCCCRNEAGKVASSLCGIDFGRDGTPWGQPYKRVVEAELAMEAMD